MDSIVKLGGQAACSKPGWMARLSSRVGGRLQSFSRESNNVAAEETRVQEEGAGRGPVPLVGVVRDRAFNFYYPENLEEIRRCGARTVEVDSLSDGTLRGIDALYIGGGFPEVHAGVLSGNTGFREDLRRRIEEGMPVYAECGGLMYLSRAFHTRSGRYPMVGVFPYEFEMSRSPEAHGYTLLRVDSDNPYFETGAGVRGHEFRYSRIINPAEGTGLTMVFSMLRGKGIAGGRDGILYKNTLAAFTHTHAESDGVRWPERLAAMARERRLESISL
jgi:cobyrinic acid a,c-diamide synthase